MRSFALLHHEKGREEQDIAIDTDQQQHDPREHECADDRLQSRQPVDDANRLLKIDRAADKESDQQGYFANTRRPGRRSRISPTRRPVA